MTSDNFGINGLAQLPNHVLSEGEGENCEFPNTLKRNESVRNRGERATTKSVKREEEKKQNKKWSYAVLKNGLRSRAESILFTSSSLWIYATHNNLGGLSN